MRGNRFILGRRALIVFLAFFLVAGAFLGAPASAQTVAGGPPPLLQAGSGDGWTEKNTPIDPTKTPTMRYEHAMAATPSGVLLFGGEGSSGYLNDTWLFDSATSVWSQVFTSTAPTVRAGHDMVATPSDDVLLFGGWNGSGYLGDTWLFNTTTNTWGQITGSPAPPQLYDPAMAATPSGAVLFGSSGAINETWLFNAATNTWMGVATTGTRPSIRSRHAMAALPSGNVLLFGGWYGSNYLGDTWLFNTTTNIWSQVSTSPTPPARGWHAMAATPSGVLLFGGGIIGASLSDTWLFNATDNTWSQITGSSTPPARAYHAMATTPAGVLLFGGQGSGPGYLNDTWLYGPITLAPPSPPPTGMPSISPWALALLTLSLLGAGGWWFLRRRRFA